MTRNDPLYDHVMVHAIFTELNKELKRLQVEIDVIRIKINELKGKMQ